MTTLRALALGAAMLGLSVTTAAADADYPNRMVRIVVPTAAGGGVDVLARWVGAKLSTRWGQQFIIENRPGAAGIIGAKAVIAAAPDGYTLMMAPSSLAITVALAKVPPYDPTRDLTPIMSLASTPYAVMVNPSLPVQSIQDLIAYAKANPGKLNYGSAGIGSASHFAAEMFKTMAGIDMVHVPNKSMGPALVDLIGGQVSMLIGGLPASAGDNKGRRVTALAAATAERSSLMADVPTVAESGLPGYAIDNWIGLLGPPSLSPAIVERLNKEIAGLLTDPQMRGELIGLGFDPIGNQPQQFRAQLEREVPALKEIAARAGIEAR